VPLPFGVLNASATAEEFALVVAPLADDTGWCSNPPGEIRPPTIGAGESINVDVTFCTDDTAAAVSPITYRISLVQTTRGLWLPVPHAHFDLTFRLF
jgi:hypothetical protein